jgi:UDP-glucuronate decarboxylase
MDHYKNHHLVTGGAGFLGSHLIDHLLRMGDKVVCLDNFYTGQLSNISKWFDNPGFEYIRHNVINPIDIDVNHIWHLACPASPIHYQANPIDTAKTNFLGTYNMLELAKAKNAKLLFASTSEVYGDPKIHPQSESYNGSVNTCGIRSCYDEGKRIGETLCFEYHRLFNLEIKVMRIFNTYGPRMRRDDGRVVSNFIVQALEGKPLTIYGDGSQTRSFCFVNDLIDGMLKIMENQYFGPINIGNPEEFSINELASLIISKVNNNLDIILKDFPEDDPMQRCPTIEKAQKLLKWQPKIPLSEGLDITIDYFKNNINNKKIN